MLSILLYVGYGTGLSTVSHSILLCYFCLSAFRLCLKLLFASFPDPLFMYPLASIFCNLLVFAAHLFRLLKCVTFIVLQVDAVTRKADEQKREADLKLTEFAQLLDIRAQRIKVKFLLFHFALACFIAAVIMSAKKKFDIFSVVY